MISLEYSIEASESKGLFYNKKFTVYVEGEDDVRFWDTLFELAEVEAYIEEVGGKEELQKKINEIIEENASFIIAADNDHSDILPDKVEHNQMIRTFGYSIENSMYCPQNLEKTIKNYCKKSGSIRIPLENWAETFSNDLFKLLVYDVANHRFGKGVQVFGDNCQRFLKNNKSIEVSKNKVEEFIRKIEPHFTKKEIDNVHDSLSKNKKKIWFRLKGHFLTHAVINLIKYYVKQTGGGKCSISHDSLYALTVDCTDNWDKRVDISVVVEKIKKLNSN